MKLDREQFDFYLINITATDHGQSQVYSFESPLATENCQEMDRELRERSVMTPCASNDLNSARTRLVVNLLNINDNRPGFDHYVLYKLQEYENMLNNEKPFTRLSAIDRDSNN